MRRIVILAAVATVLVALVVGAIFFSFDNTAETTGSPPLETISESVSPETDLAIPLHDEPKPLPAISFVDGEGRETTLESFSGRIVLLNIWATWCVPCREEMPSLDRLEASLGGSDFQVVALSIDRGGLSVVRDFYRELDLKALDIYVDQTGDAARRLGIVGIPTTLLIGPSGRELGRLPGPAVWDSEPAMQFIGRILLLTTGGDCNCPMRKQGAAVSGP